MIARYLFAACLGFSVSTPAYSQNLKSDETFWCIEIDDLFSARTSLSLDSFFGSLKRLSITDSTVELQGAGLPNIAYDVVADDWVVIAEQNYAAMQDNECLQDTENLLQTAVDDAIENLLNGLNTDLVTSNEVAILPECASVWVPFVDDLPFEDGDTYRFERLIFNRDTLRLTTHLVVASPFEVSNTEYTCSGADFSD